MKRFFYGLLLTTVVTIARASESSYIANRLSSGDSLEKVQAAFGQGTLVKYYPNHNLKSYRFTPPSGCTNQPWAAFLNGKLCSVWYPLQVDPTSFMGGVELQKALVAFQKDGWPSTGTFYGNLVEYHNAKKACTAIYKKKENELIIASKAYYDLSEKIVKAKEAGVNGENNPKK